MTVVEIQKDRLKEQRLQFIRAHQEAFEVEPVYPLRLFEDFVMEVEGDCNLEASCKIELDKLIASRFMLFFKDKAQHWAKYLNHSLAFFSQVENRVGVHLDYSLLQQFLGHDFDFSKVTVLSAGIDLRKNLPDSSLKIHIRIKDYPEKLDRAFSLSDGAADSNYLRGFVELIGFDLYFNGDSEIEIYAEVKQEDFFKPETKNLVWQANLTRLPTLVLDKASANGQMSTHGTHIASVIFGQPKSIVKGIAPRCRGLLAPVFADDAHRKLSQLDLARAIEQAAENGAQVINISGGSLTDMGEAEDWLDRAVQMCRDRNILIVAAAGNDGCECLHVPAALPAVLAVGATDARGHPLDFSNWGETYQSQGILAPGENILGAKPGGGTVQLSGTSFAAPIVAGVAALLLGLQVQRGETPNPQAVREAILKSALPCKYNETENHRKCLAGVLNIPGAIKYLTGETMSELIEASGCGCGSTHELSEVTVKPKREIEPAEVVAAGITQSE